MLPTWIVAPVMIFAVSTLNGGRTGMSSARVLAVAAHAEHAFSKPLRPEIRLLEGLGVEGDAHCGVTVRHRSRVARDPTQPNLRQVHLIQAELFDELAGQGYCVGPGQLGENITTQGLQLLALPRGTLLCLGAVAVVEVMGLRNPCVQIDTFAKGLMAATLARGPDGALVRKAGVMGVVRKAGTVRPGDVIQIVEPIGPHQALAVV